MGILFALSSSLMVRSLDRSNIKTLRSRLQRLLPVLWLLAALAVPAMFLKGWDDKPPLWRLVFWVVPIADPPGSSWAESATEPLWYLRSLVWFILLSPILLILFRWYPKSMMLLSVGVLVLLGYKKVGFDWTGEVTSPVIVDGLTFLPCWFLGFAHREGMLKKIPAAVVVIGGLILAGFGTYWVLTHKVVDGGAPSYDFNLFDMAQGLYSLGIAAILLRFSPKFSWIGNHRFVDRIITIINGRAMVIYLWHNIAIELSYPIGDRFNVWQYGESAATAICLGIALVLTALGVLAFGWIEDVAAGRRPQLLPKELGKKPTAAAEAPPAEQVAPSAEAPAYDERPPQPATVYGSPGGYAPPPQNHEYDNGYQRYDNRAYDNQGYDDRRGYDDRYDRQYQNNQYENNQYDDRRYDDRPQQYAAEERRYDDRPYSAPPAPPRPPVRVAPQQRQPYPDERPRGRTYGSPSNTPEETVPSFDQQQGPS
jgi:peptidoglycan/LPS O-acetylase OafA/YrhL